MPYMDLRTSCTQSSLTVLDHVWIGLPVFCPSTAKGPNLHIDYFEIIGDYCAGPSLTCTLKTNLGIVFREVRTLNQVVL